MIDDSLAKIFERSLPGLPSDGATADERALIEPIIGVRGARVGHADRMNVQLMAADNRVLWTGDLRSESLVAHVALALGRTVVLAPMGTKEARMGQIAFSSRGIVIWPPDA